MFWPEHELTRSQDLPEAYHDAGQFYWGRGASLFMTKTSSFLRMPCLWSYPGTESRISTHQRIGFALRRCFEQTTNLNILSRRKGSLRSGRCGSVLGQVLRVDSGFLLVVIWTK